MGLSKRRQADPDNWL